MFQTFAIYPEAAVSVTGETQHYLGRHFCPRCGSSVYSRTGDAFELHLGALDGDNQLAPSYELWTVRRETWLPPLPGVKSYSKNRETDAMS